MRWASSSSTANVDFQHQKRQLGIEPSPTAIVGRQSRKTAGHGQGARPVLMGQVPRHLGINRRVASESSARRTDSIGSASSAESRPSAPGSGRSSVLQAGASCP